MSNNQEVQQAPISLEGILIWRDQAVAAGEAGQLFQVQPTDMINLCDHFVTVRKAFFQLAQQAVQMKAQIDFLNAPEVDATPPQPCGVAPCVGHDAASEAQETAENSGNA